MITSLHAVVLPIFGSVDKNKNDVENLGPLQKHAQRAMRAYQGQTYQITKLTGHDWPSASFIQIYHQCQRAG